MTAQLLLAFVLFAFATAGTPGPNNMMLLASGANFGFRRTVLHILGISVGLGVMVLAMGLGLGGVFKAWPVLHEVLRWVGGAYMLWLAWKIATPRASRDKDAGAKPMTFLQAAAFQWVNPKAWAMALTAATTYTPEGSTAACSWWPGPSCWSARRAAPPGRASARACGGSWTGRRCCGPST
jgi:threonine/homoserine/homoserine lactone efflux protein